MNITELERKELQEEVEKIARAILDNKLETNDIGFLSGESGIAFFFSILGSYSDNEEYLAVGIKIISKIHEEIASGIHVNPTFSGGIAGYSWMLEYLDQQGIIAVDTDNLLEEVDEFLYTSMLDFLKKGNFDFLHGAGGIIVYFLRRISGDSKQKDKLSAYLHQAVNLLEVLSISERDMLKWQTKLNSGTVSPVTNISLSHGMSSIVVVLCKLIKGNIYPDKCMFLLKGAVTYLHSNRQDAIKYGSYFPTVSLDVNRKPDYSRLGWCYGDLGVANSLNMAGTCLEDGATLRVAEEIFGHLRKRRNLLENRIQDACLCHGTSGVALFAYQIYQNNPNLENKEFFSYWLSSTLEMGNAGSGIEGYMYHDNRLEGDQKALRLNFLEGLAGIGTLFAAIAYPEHGDLKWLETLLLC